MALNVLSWALFIFTVWGSGFVLLRPFPLLKTERIALGFVIGSTALPFVIFLVNTLTHGPILSYSYTGFIFTVIILVIIFGLLMLELFSRKTALKKHTMTLSPVNPLQRLIMILTLVALLLFFYVVYEGVTKPIYGWDEFSYWLYAAKLIFLTGGSSTALRHDLYSSYPLGFPYLIAWCYHFFNHTSVQTAKLISPMITLASLIVMERALVRSGIQRTFALIAVALTAWGTFTMLYYNWVAFGEMIYVDTYGLGILYAALWLREKQSRELYLSGLLIGLSTFLRVDGLYIAIFTLVILYVSNWRNNNSIAFSTGVKLLLLALVPALIWHLFRVIYHMDSGWTTRISFAVIRSRLQSPVLPSLVYSMWSTIFDLRKFPIDILLPLIILVLPFSRRREVLFLLLVVLAQFAYLFVAYIAVFTTYEASHASSLPRYMLRNDPIIAIAYAFLLNGKGTIKNSFAKKGRSRKTKARST